MAANCHTATLELHEMDYDAQLMLRAKVGDRNAFEQLIRKHRPPIVRYAFRMVHDRTAAEDIAQEVFLRIYRSRAGYEGTAKFTTWLYRIASHVSLNWIRDHSRSNSHLSLEIPRGHPLHAHFIDRTARIDEWLIFQTAMDQVRAAVSDLPERQRRIVMLHKFEEMGCDEIASLLGCSAQAIRSTLCRAYTTLRRGLGED